MQRATRFPGRIAAAAMVCAFALSLLSPASLSAEYLERNASASHTVLFQTDGTEGATLDGVTTQTVADGADCTPVRAVASTGYLFDQWTESGHEYSLANPLTVRNVTASMALTARFEPDRYVITFQTDGTPGTRLEGVLGQVVPYRGDATPVTAVAPTGYRLLKWTVDGSYYSTDNPLTVTNVTESMDLTAVFTLDLVTVTFQTDGTPGATLSGTTEQVVVVGGDCWWVRAIQPAGYRFAKWTENGARFSTENPLKATNVTTTMTLTATFSIKQYTVTFQTDGTPGATLSGVTTQRVDYKSDCTSVTAHAAGNYSFSHWIKAGSDDYYSMSSTLAPTTIRKKMTFTAVYTHDRFQWAWMKGAGTDNREGVYGTRGTGATTTTPGTRHDAVSWTGADGTLWLFGGEGRDANRSHGYLNDLWNYDQGSGNWTWMKGSTVIDQSGIYGTSGTAAGTNTPGARAGAVSWTDPAGALWLFGGWGYGAEGESDSLNDLWKYTPATGNWTWMR